MWSVVRLRVRIELCYVSQLVHCWSTQHEQLAERRRTRNCHRNLKPVARKLIASLHNYFFKRTSFVAFLKEFLVYTLQKERDTKTMPPELYHERQTLYRCGLHALNNVLQGPIFTKTSLDDTCTELTTRTDRTATNGLLPWVWNPHRAPLGLGNYDINALTLALEQKGYAMQWMDKRVPVDENVIKFDELEGVLCNVILTTMFSSLWVQRHWFAVRKIQGVCYNLDSKLPAPMPFERETECYQFLQELVNTGECELFLIRKKNQKTASANCAG